MVDRYRFFLARGGKIRGRETPTFFEGGRRASGGLEGDGPGGGPSQGRRLTSHFVFFMQKIHFSKKEGEPGRFWGQC